VSIYEYRVLYRVKGSGTWIQHGPIVEQEERGGRAVVNGLSNGVVHEFMVVRDKPSARESMIVEGEPIAGIERPPDTFVPTGDQVVESGVATGQLGFYNDEEGVLLNYTQGANWNSFDVFVIGSDGVETLLCTVQKSPKRVIINGVSLEFSAQSLVIELPGGKQFFINTGGGADISVRPNGQSFAPFTLEIT